MQIVTTASTASTMAPPIVSNESISEKSMQLDLKKSAPKMKLVMLSVELSGIIDKVLKGRMQSQKGHNEKIDEYNDLLSELRKLQKSSSSFSADSLENIYVDVVPGSRASIFYAKRKDEEGLWDAIRDERIRQDPDLMAEVFVRLNKEYEINVASGKASLSDMLHSYEVYKVTEALPATKEELEAATEKISAIIGAIESTQDLKMTDIQKFTNSRNEAYDLAVSVNNAKVESLKTLIAMIGEH